MFIRFGSSITVIVCHQSATRLSPHLLVLAPALLKIGTQPWLVWLSGLGGGSCEPKGCPFPVRAHAWVVGQVPSLDMQEATTH